MFSKSACLSALLITFTFFVFAQNSGNKAFRIVPLGIRGGIDESNLSAYLVAAGGSDDYICLDAGTLHVGIEKAIRNKVFSAPAEEVLRKNIKAYLISHAHLDHIMGLVINSPDDTAKSIYGLADCLQTIKTHYFTWQSWANFTDEGETPLLRKYHYQPLFPGNITNISNTTIKVTAFPLSHSNVQSTAFLLNNNHDYLLYLGDTGPDQIEKSQNLHLLWQQVAPLIKSRQLKAILMETSYPDEQPDQSLFGHLTPRWLMKEMEQLATATGKKALKGFKLIVTHNKPPLKNIQKIKKQLRDSNTLLLQLIFPEQGRAIDLE